MSLLVTGASGFLGTIISQTLVANDVLTLGRGNNSDYQCDLAKRVPSFNRAFDTVIHAAGKAHSVPGTDEERQDFYQVNVIGTKNLLEGLENGPALPKSFVFISSVAVYGLETGSNVNEETQLLAKDPYGDSKIQAEILIHDWSLRNNVICTILRLLLIAGPNPPRNLGAMIKGIKRGYYFNIAGGKAKKSIVLAEDVAKIIPVACKIGGIYNLTDGYHPSFKELGFTITRQLRKKPPLNLPGFLAKTIALGGDILGSKAPLNSDKLNKMTSDLTFDDSKARDILGWKPTAVLEAFEVK